MVVCALVIISDTGTARPDVTTLVTRPVTPLVRPRQLAAERRLNWADALFGAIKNVAGTIIAMMSSTARTLVKGLMLIYLQIASLTCRHET